MNKLAVAIIAFALTTTICSAQSDNGNDLREKLAIGAKVGMNISNVYDSEGEDFDSKARAGFAVGGFISVPIGTYLGIQPEIQFSQRGFKGTGRILGKTYDIKRISNYLDIPLLVAIKPIEYVTIFAGPQYSYLMKQKDSFKNGDITIEQIKEFDNENIRRNMFAFTGGFDVNIKHVVIGTRAGVGLLKNKGDGTSTTPRYKEVWFQATLGYRFL